MAQLPYYTPLAVDTWDAARWKRFLFYLAHSIADFLGITPEAYKALAEANGLAKDERYMLAFSDSLLATRDPWTAAVKTKRRAAQNWVALTGDWRATRWMTTPPLTATAGVSPGQKECIREMQSSDIKLRAKLQQVEARAPGPWRDEYGLKTVVPSRCDILEAVMMHKRLVPDIDWKNVPEPAEVSE
ncbi:unnamed protein product, partial [Amoebophrya sp. A120]|eukprot:GSA120T00025022001.1